ncbi:unnamed protein product [Cyclocybe aegerita]|uniref:Exonuclease 1 n=1 Tax=Cyclocybe aegerita TaxID=1973307 RepID=A0A8S0VVQ4_CYCAE|nr:unnamed protein product [Cyclocybe aegerita]
MASVDFETEDILSEALEFLGGKPIIDDTIIRYGPLVLTLAPKEGKANTLLADHLFSPALFLAERIERGLLDLGGATVIELGAGSALPSLLLSTQPNPPTLIVVTDYPDEGILGNLKQNVERNRSSVADGCRVECRGYEWGTDHSGLLQLSKTYDVVILSDLLHFLTSHDVLVSSIEALLAMKRGAKVYVGAGKYTHTDVCDNFLEKGRMAGLVFEEITVPSEEMKWMGQLEVPSLDAEALALRKANSLKSIQVTRHLSEFKGKTIAVDAYVWLHKGLYSCATELATGKKTHKYVNYAMHRVRLLKHHGIEPYIVFDGGPLPAKKGTEKERKQKRDENLARGNALAAQGKHSQAREYYTKCVDITPQMAFQFIKALRAESVQYVVAPYEADAQLAYLERVGLADAILTEDSDLLVFGCKNVLYKLDVVASTVVSISRADFGSVSASSADPTSISLIGWSDVQFRAMAILSGCDYLPSIPGVGLKTANSLLRKWKTPEQVVRALSLEGKKAVPIGYWKQYQLAEKCFLHQRVYCPLAERLVHWTDVAGDWSDEFDAYVGGDMEPTLAKQIALGDADPETRLPMDDINPSFLPRTVKPLGMAPVSPAKSNKGKGKMRASLPAPGGIMSFFGPNPIIPPRTKHPQASPVHTRAPKLGMTGKASGKRTLAEVMDQDIERKKKRKSASPLRSTQSKFFSPRHSPREASIQRRHSEGVVFLAGPSRIQDDDKENANRYIVVDDDDTSEAETSEPELDGTELLIQANFNADAVMELSVEDFPDVVEQEDGYISPMRSSSRDAADLSSPPRPGGRLERGEDEEMEPTGMILSDHEDHDLSVDPVSSPVSTKRPTRTTRRHQPYRTPTKGNANHASGSILVDPTPTPTKSIYPDIDEVPSPTLFHGPDLRSMLGNDDSTSDLDGLPDVKRIRHEDSLGSGFGSGSVSPPSPSPETPVNELACNNSINVVIDVDELDFGFDEEDGEAGLARTKAVMDGWRNKWALPSKQPVGPTGGQNPMKAKPGSSTNTPTSSRPPSRPASVRSSPKKKLFTPGSGAARALALRRNETNVTPAGRHNLAQTEFYKPPKSAPSKIGANGSGTGTPSLGVKPKRSTLVFETMTAQKTKEVVDLTASDDERQGVGGSRRPASAAPVLRYDDEILARGRMRLAQFRCS